MFFKITASIDNNIINQSSSSFNYGESPLLYMYHYNIDDTHYISRALLGFDFSEFNNLESSGVINSNNVSDTATLFLSTAPVSCSVSIVDEDIEIGYLSSSWSEGSGSSDGGGNEASNWLTASIGNSWNTSGSDYTYFKTITKEKRFEDIQIDFPLADLTSSYGFILKYTDSEETGSFNYFKAIYSTQNDYGLKKPFVQIKINDFIGDDRCGFSTWESGSIYFYNYDYRGNPKDVPNGVSICEISASSFIASASVGRVSVGIYSASFFLTNSYGGTITDSWYDNSNVLIASSSFPVYDYNTPFSVYESSVKDISLHVFIKPVYNYQDILKVKVYGYAVNDFNRTGSFQTLTILDDLYYSVIDCATATPVIDFDDTYTKCSYDKNGNYFNFAFGYLAENRKYKFIFKHKMNNSDVIFDPGYIFTVEGYK